MVVIEIGSGVRITFDTIRNVAQEQQELQRHNCACGFIGKSAVIKYPQLLLIVKISSIIVVKSSF